MSKTSPAGRTSLVLALAVAGVTLVAAPGAASAHQGPGGNFGFGLGVGAPTGLSLEIGAGYWSSFELAIGLDAFDDGGGYGHFVYKASVANLATGPTVHVPFYLGVGGYLYDHERSFEDDTEIGVRIPFGVNFDFQRSPLQLFVEVAVGIPLRDTDNDAYDRDAWVGGYGGFRLWF